MWGLCQNNRPYDVALLPSTLMIYTNLAEIINDPITIDTPFEQHARAVIKAIYLHPYINKEPRTRVTTITSSHLIGIRNGNLCSIRHLLQVQRGNIDKMTS